MRNVTNEDGITVTIMRVGGVTTTVNVPEESTVDTVLLTAGITLGSSESVYFNGEEVNTASAIADDGDAVQIVQNKKGGTR